MPAAPQALAPLASLAAHWQACSGDVPPALVGASVTLVDAPDDPKQARLYLFGGRLVTTRRMVNDMYQLDLVTLKWTRLFSEQDASSSSAQRPMPRYFHSCNLWNNKLVIFGGMGYAHDGADADLCVLNETMVFDLATRTWHLDFAQPGTSASGEKALLPQARYAHLSSVTGDALVVIGGQDLNNSYVEEINVFDLHTRQWKTKSPFAKQRGSYRSLAVEPQWHIASADSVSPIVPSVHSRSRSGSVSSSRHARQASEAKNALEAISFLPTSTLEYTEDGKVKPLPIYVYTNYNFTDVKREMEVMHVASSTNQSEASSPQVTIDDRSGAMTGVSLPPGLRFPMGSILGSHLLISGIYLANTSQTFAIWALHLPTMTWTRLDVGALLASGSWNRGVCWPSQSRLIIFGHRDRDLVADYNHRQTNWDHVLLIELDAWGICQPPIFTPNRAAAELGLRKLASSTVGSFSASLEADDGTLSDKPVHPPQLAVGGCGDFEIVCADGMKLGCDRAILEQRWPWFATQMQAYRSRLRRTAKSVMGDDWSNGLTVLMEEDELGNGKKEDKGSKVQVPKADPRITPRQLVVNEPSPVMLAILMFLYTRCICTPLQRHPAIVAALLIASRVYEMEEMAEWVQFAAHHLLSTTLLPPAPTSSNVTSPSTPVQDSPLPIIERHRLAVAIYEAATISGFEALQIRALRNVMSVAKWVQKNSLNSRSSSFVGSTDEAAADKEVEAQGGARSRLVSSSQGLRRPSGGAPGASDASSAAFSRRDSRAERLLQLRDADDGAMVRLSSSTHSSGPPSSFPASLTSSRRPSAPSAYASARSHAGSASSSNEFAVPSTPSSGNDGRSLRGPPPSSASASPASSTVRKRFSLFGRASDAGKPAPLASSDGADIDGMSGSPWDNTVRMQRANTDGNLAEEGTLAQHNGSSSQGAHASSTSVGLGHFGNWSGSQADGVNHKDTRHSDRNGGSAGSAAGRKMSATLDRLRSAARSSTAPNNSGTSVPQNSLSAAFEGMEINGINPGRPEPQHVPSSARSSLAPSFTRPSSSNGKMLRNADSASTIGPATSASAATGTDSSAASTFSGQQSTNGRLSERDLKALQSIWT